MSRARQSTRGVGRPNNGLPAASGRLQRLSSSAPGAKRSSQGKPRSSVGSASASPVEADGRDQVPSPGVGPGNRAVSSLHAAPCRLVGGEQGRTRGDLGIERGGELERERILDGPRRRDHGPDARVQQTGSLCARRAAVEENQFQVPPLPQEPRQPLGVRHRSIGARRLEEQPVAAGMPPVMKDRHPIFVLGECLEDLVERGIGTYDELAQSFSPGGFKDGL